MELSVLPLTTSLQSRKVPEKEVVDLELCKYYRLEYSDSTESLARIWGE